LDGFKNESLTNVIEWGKEYGAVLKGLDDSGFRLAYSFLNEFGQVSL